MVVPSIDNALFDRISKERQYRQFDERPKRSQDMHCRNLFVCRNSKAKRQFLPNRCSFYVSEIHASPAPRPLHGDWHPCRHCRNVSGGLFNSACHAQFWCLACDFFPRRNALDDHATGLERSRLALEYFDDAARLFAFHPLKA